MTSAPLRTDRVCILGLPRSGAGAALALLRALEPRLDDATARVDAINEQLLARFGGAWSEPPALAHAWSQSSSLDPLRAAAAAAARPHRGSALWACADAALSLTLPYWRPHLGTPRCVVCVRNPLDVARSLAHVLPVDLALDLWLTYLDSILRATADLPRLILSYEDVIADPLSQLDRLGAHIGANERASDASVRDAALSAIDETLWHRRTPLVDLLEEPLVPLGVKSVYSAICLGQGDAEVASALARAPRAPRERATARSKRQASQPPVPVREPKRDAAPTAPALTPEEYPLVVERVRAAVVAAAPPGSVVAVVSKGDSELLRLEAREGWHFPHTADGVYAGHHPADTRDVVSRLERAVASGADFIVFPATSTWWLDHYEGLRAYLDERHDLVCDDPATCVIYRLVRAPEARAPRPAAEPGDASRRMRELADLLLPADSSVIVLHPDGVQAARIGTWTTPAAVETSSRAGRLATIERMHAGGASYLLVPDDLPLPDDVEQRLRRRYRVVTRQRHVATIYDLERRPRRRTPRRRFRKERAHA